MCGIVGMIGKERFSVKDDLIRSLQRLEYRGYDSAGVAMAEDSHLEIVRAVGRISALEQKLAGRRFGGSWGMAHTRWATHGEPSEINAHPQQDAAGRIAIVHNGIIENYFALKTYLQQQGVEFRSETDTEVLAQLIARFYDGNLEQAVRSALQGTDVNSIRQAMQELSDVMQKVGAAVYGQQQPPPPGGEEPPPGKEGGDEGTVEGEFHEV